ncbi:MAG: Hsp20/alpha crystallin family protein [Oscillospiraceae bacterium]|nr:Hsp20/alpha crystallin family protein [Oscillospiraceae bacterium]
MFGMLPFERSDVSYEPFRFMRDFMDQGSTSLPSFRTDIKDNGDQFLLEAELPGFDKEDIHLDLKDGILTISAEHRQEDEQKDDSGYIRRERSYRSLARRFDVTGIDESAISAAYQNGILALSLPKAVPTVPEAKRIAIS